MDIHRADYWPGLDELATLRMFASPSAGSRDVAPAAREAFHPLGWREPPVRRVRVGLGAGEFRPDDRREPPPPTSHAQ